MNPVSNTAYYCCGVRMLDAEYPRSLCHDVYAKRFMDERGMQIFEPFKSETMPNISNSVRCHTIDEAIRSQLMAYPDSLIVTIGAGFDTRPYRIAEGEWLEVDEPQIINYKNEKLPLSECHNKLTRISINFSSESLTEKLADYRQRQHIIIVIEGVFMYLDNSAINSIINQLQTLFPKHILLCDLMTKKFFHQFAQSVHDKIVAAGAHFTERPEKPDATFKQLGYIEHAYTPNFKRASELGILWERARIPRPVAWLLLKTVLKNILGYGIYEFHYG